MYCMPKSRPFRRPRVRTKQRAAPKEPCVNDSGLTYPRAILCSRSSPTAWAASMPALISLKSMRPPVRGRMCPDSGERSRPAAPRESERGLASAGFVVVVRVMYSRLLWELSDAMSDHRAQGHRLGRTHPAPRSLFSVLQKNHRSTVHFFVSWTIKGSRRRLGQSARQRRWHRETAPSFACRYGTPGGAKRRSWSPAYRLGRRIQIEPPFTSAFGSSTVHRPAY